MILAEKIDFSFTTILPAHEARGRAVIRKGRGLVAFILSIKVFFL